MGVYDTLILPGTKADGEQVKCWFNQMRNIRVGDEVTDIVTVRLKTAEEMGDVLGIHDESYMETFISDYVIVMRCDGCLVVRDCKLQGYYIEAELVPGDPPVQELPVFDKWGEPWDFSNRGILGEPYFYHDAAVVRTINALARAYRYRDFGDDQDERSG